MKLDANQQIAIDRALFIRQAVNYSPVAPAPGKPQSSATLPSS